MLKILQTRFQHELPDVQAGFRKGRGTRDQTANNHWIMEKTRELKKKKLTSALLITLKPLCRTQQAVKNSSGDGNTKPLDLPLEKSVCRSGSNS